MGTGEDIKFGLAGVGALGSALTRGLKKQGLKLRAAYGYINIDYLRGHKGSDTDQMDRLMLVFKELLDGTATLEPRRASHADDGLQEDHSNDATEAGRAAPLAAS